MDIRMTVDTGWGFGTPSLRKFFAECELVHLVEWEQGKKNKDFIFLVVHNMKFKMVRLYWEKWWIAELRDVALPSLKKKAQELWMERFDTPRYFVYLRTRRRLGL